MIAIMLQEYPVWPGKAKKIIEELKMHGALVSTRAAILFQYTKYFGNWYGKIIFD